MKREKRETGFYWIKIHKEWTIAEYSDGTWNLVGNEACLTDEELKIEDIIMPRIGWQPEFIRLTMKCPVCGKEGLPMTTRKDKPVHFICVFKNDNNETCGTEIIVRPKGAEKPIVL